MPYLLAILSGVIYFVSTIGFEQWYLAWVAIVPLFFALDKATPKQGFFIGWLYGTVAMLGIYYWITYTIHVFAYMPWIISGTGCLILCIVQGTRHAVFGFLYAWIHKRSRLSPLILGTSIYVATEFICPQLFPHYFANSQYLRLPVIQICDVTGVFGVTALIVFVNACVYLVLKELIEERRFRWSMVVAGIVIASIVVGYGYLRLPVIKSEMEYSPKLRFGITQANLGIREKSINPAKSIQLNQEQTLRLKEAGADIVVWPETAVQRPVLRPGIKKLPEVVFDDLGLPLLIGALQWGPRRGSNPPLYNVAVLSDKDGGILGVYKKRKLLMLGEYIPLGETFPKLYEYFPYIARMWPGESYEPLKFGDYLLNVNICYEEILPRFMGKMAAFSPNVFINLTNDNWFGRTHEPLQHFAISVFRSIEHRLWLVRSTNTGISAFVDATGKIVARSPLMEPDTLIQNVPMMRSSTLYTRYGDWFAWICVILTVIFAFKNPKSQTSNPK